MHRTTRDLVASCLKVKPSDGSIDTEFHTQRNDAGDVRITKIKPMHKDIPWRLVDLTWQKGAAGAISIPGDVILISSMFQQGFDAPHGGT